MAKKQASSGLTTSKSRNVGAEQKALWHNTLGAGRSRVVREFLGLTLADEGWVLAKALELADKRLGQQFR